MVTPDASWSESRKTFGNLCSLLDLNLHLRLVMSSVPFWAQMAGCTLRFHIFGLILEKSGLCWDSVS